MPENQLRPHIRVEGFKTEHPFATPQSARDRFRIKERVRRTHGRELLAQLKSLEETARQRIEAQHRLSDTIPAGVYVQFESEPGFELASESLGREQSGIELLSVVQAGNRHFATVFVPDGKLERFEQLVRQYLTESPAASPDKAKHQKLINNIASIRLATIKALWTDDPELYPTGNEPVWWEVWLRVGDDREAFLDLFRKHSEKLGIEVSERHLRFLERTVVAARGTIQQLAKSVSLLNCVAELRRLKAAASFFMTLRPQEQKEWIDDLILRIDWPGGDAPAVCLLDTGVFRNHPLLSQGFAPADLHTINPSWGPGDGHGHGTNMAGLVLHGDLTTALDSNGQLEQLHIGESVKLLSQNSDNQGQLYGELTRDAISRAEIAQPGRKRIICMAVTAMDDRDRGKPSSWSASIDAMASGAEDETRRLFVLSAGNTNPNAYGDYPTSNSTDAIHDPAQSWNALTVGACTFKTEIDQNDFPGAIPLACSGDLSPFSCTSTGWRNEWPCKPDITYEGGNLAKEPDFPPSDLDDLQLLTTHLAPPQQFDLMNGTSAATALAARLCARIQARYPNLWPETIRALVVHSAEWTPAMLERYKPSESRENARALLRECGHGVPNEKRAIWSASNELTLLVESTITPFEAAINFKGQITHFHAREMVLHGLPWPIDELHELGAMPVEMRVTLSYFVEPNPSERGWTKRYLYESHGLRFEVKRAHEDDTEFLSRINLKARAEEDRRLLGSQDDGWLLGPRLRHLGSVHSDRWRGSASDLAERGQIAIYPTMGWWRERRSHEKWNSRARYSLVVSILTPETDVDLQAAVQAQIATNIPAT